MEAGVTRYCERVMTAKKTNTPDFRRAKIAKIKVASKTLALDDGSYRALLHRITGKESCADMNISQLDAVLDEFKRLGFKTKKKAGTRKQADGAQAAKIRALWIMLHHMGATDDSSEHALSKFAKRSCGIDDLHWIDWGHADKIIRALRGWMDRLGYRHPNAEQVDVVRQVRSLHKADDGTEYTTIAAKLNLISFQTNKLGKPAAAQPDTRNRDVLILKSSHELDKIIAELGAKIRQ